MADIPSDMIEPRLWCCGGVLMVMRLLVVMPIYLDSHIHVNFLGLGRTPNLGHNNLTSRRVEFNQRPNTEGGPRNGRLIPIATATNRRKNKGSTVQLTRPTRLSKM